MSRTIYKCPYCDKKYVATDKSKQANAKKSLYEHMECNHHDMLNNRTPAQVYFNHKYNKSAGKCVICGKETEWNEATERYNRFCSVKCKNEYCRLFKQRMKEKYGSEHILNDPDQQKKMLANRKISGSYKWHDGSGEVHYVGTYEREFLEFLDLVMEFKVVDVIEPAPQVFYYEYENRKHFYIPDFYIPSLNLLIEIKDTTNKHHKIVAVDRKKEAIKDDLMAKQKEYNYVKVTDKDYSIFLNYLINLKYSS